MKRLGNGLLALAAITLLSAASYDLPPEHPVDLGNSPEAALVTETCAACHSLDYIIRQPDLGAAGWTAEVTKMRAVYGANVDDDSAKRIAAWLATRK